MHCAISTTNNTFTAIAETAQTKTKALLLTAIGNTLELYEFALFGYFAPLIAKLFFPQQTPFLGLMITYTLFAAGFLIRPFGAILFGYFGDRLGRKKTLSLSILCMAIPTTLIGCLPTYEQIGSCAVVPLLICRLLQGLALSGERVGAIIYMMEHSPSHRRGLYGSWVLLSGLLGFLLGSTASSTLGLLISPADLQTWGWRVPFLLAAILGAIGLYFRLRLPETPIFTNLQQHHKLTKNPLRTAMQHAALPMLRGFSLNLSVSVVFYFLTNYLSAYLVTYLHVPLGTALTLNNINMLVLMFLVFIIAWLSDHIGRKPIIIFALVGFIIFSYPLFLLLQQGNFMVLLLGDFGFVVLVASLYAIVPATLVELTPAAVRYTAIALPYNLAYALFGGMLPLTATFLIEKTGNIISPSYCLIIAAIISLITLATMPDGYKKSICTPRRA